MWVGILLINFYVFFSCSSLKSELEKNGYVNIYCKLSIVQKIQHS